MHIQCYLDICILINIPCWTLVTILNIFFSKAEDTLRHTIVFGIGLSVSQFIRWYLIMDIEKINMDISLCMVKKDRLQIPQLRRTIGHFIRHLLDDIYLTFIGTFVGHLFDIYCAFIGEIFGCLFGMLKKHESNGIGTIAKPEKKKNYYDCVGMHCLHCNKIYYKKSTINIDTNEKIMVEKNEKIDIQ